MIKQILDNFHFKVDPTLTQEQNAQEVIRGAALLSAAVSAEPLPFADALLITPIQMKMVIHLGKIYGFEPSLGRAKVILAELGGTFAYGFLGRQVIRGLGKVVVPVIGGLITAPAVYGWTFALGKLSEVYFKGQLAGGKPLDALQAKQITLEALKEATEEAPSLRVISEFAESLRARAKDRSNSTETHASKGISKNSDEEPEGKN